MTAPRPPVVVRQSPPAKSNYRDYEPELREDFVCSCAYCTITETEAQGIGFQIDHYDPVDHAPELVNDFQNLLWSCQPCNRQKGSFHPTAEELAAGIYILRPDREHPLDHYELRGDELAGTTKTGESNILLLLLNRAALQKLRARRRRLGAAQDTIVAGIGQLLALSIDQLPKHRRGFLLRLRRELPAEIEQLRQVLAEHVRAEACSLLIDEDPEHMSRINARREFLAAHRAVNEDAVPKRRDDNKKKRRKP